MTTRIPYTLRKYSKIILDVSLDSDGYQIMLKDGYHFEDCHSVMEDSLRECAASLDRVETCSCPQCAYSRQAELKAATHAWINRIFDGPDRSDFGFVIHYDENGRVVCFQLFNAMKKYGTGWQKNFDYLAGFRDKILSANEDAFANPRDDFDLWVNKDSRGELVHVQLMNLSRDKAMILRLQAAKRKSDAPMLAKIPA